MKVFYNPSFQGFVYQDFSENDIIFNMTTCNTKGLISLIELHAGLSFPIKSDFDRVLDYYIALKEYVKENPTNIFAKSFERDGINTAKECLKWRDAFILAGWKPCKNDSSERQKVLSHIEKNFNSISEGEKLLKIIKAVEDDCSLPENLEIIIPFDYNCFKPAERKLLNELLKRIGEENIYVYKDFPKNENDLHKIADIILNNKPDNITLENIDDSFEIIGFEEKNEALQYLSQIDAKEYSVWINRNNKTFDEWLSFVKKPTCGSLDNGQSQLSILPLIGLGLFSKPLNLTSLINWLSVPLSPLSKNIRNKLIESIVSTGGYFNDACREIIETADEYDKTVIPYFLPDISKPEEAFSNDSRIKIQTLEKYLVELEKWINKKIYSSEITENQKTQLLGALNICSALGKILKIVEEDEISYDDLMLTLDTFSTEIDTENTTAQKNCQNLINASWNVSSKSETTIWCDFYNPEEQKLSYSFILPSEKNSLPDIWKEEDERTFLRNNKYLPFVYTEKKLTLVTVKKDGTKDVEKDPLFIRFEKNMGTDESGKDKIEKYILHKDVMTINGVKEKEVEKFYNRGQNEDGTINFTRTDLVKFRETESFSSISTLIEHPLDYVLSKTAKLRLQGASALSAVYTTKGTVAHAIIEELFNPKHGGTPKDIKQQIDSRFNEVLNQKILENGGILLQKENLSETEIFKGKMKDCVVKLLNLIEQNNLKVVACEQSFDKVAIPEFAKANISFNGSIDMILEDEKGNPFVFDFKFSPKTDKYEGLIQENRAMQLSLYNGLIAKTTQKNAKAVAYILLPEVKVVTAEELKGYIYKKDVKEERKGNLLVEMMNSYEYRKNQILNGIVEDGEEMEASLLEYNIDSEEKNLVPLDIEEHKKKGTSNKAPNKYSNYQIFKAGK